MPFTPAAAYTPTPQFPESWWNLCLCRVENPSAALLILQRRNLIIGRRVVLGHELRQRTSRRLAIGLEEKDGRMSDGDYSLVHRENSRDRNLVDASLDDIVRPPLQRIADVDNHLRRPARRRRKHGKKRRWIAAVLQLQPTDAVLEQKSYDTEVGVRPGPFDLALTQRLQADLRVVKNAKLACVGLAPVHKGTGGELQAKFHGSNDLKTSALQKVIASLAHVAEPGKFLFFWPSVWVLGITEGAYVDMLLSKVSLGLQLH